MDKNSDKLKKNQINEEKESRKITYACHNQNAETKF